MRLSYDFNDGHDRLAFLVNNVADERYFIDTLAVGPQLTGAVQRYYEAPRWFGFEMSHAF